MTMLHDERKLRRDPRICGLGGSLSASGHPHHRRVRPAPASGRPHEAPPEVDVHLLVDNTETLLSKLSDGSLDFAIVEGLLPEGGV